MTTGHIRIGPAGWSYKDWEGIVYPPHGSKFDHLAYLANYFDTIEINSTFYRVPPPTHGRSWARRTASNSDFRFTVKLYRGYTHGGEAPTENDRKAFRTLLEDLSGADRLGAVLVQFPWSFKNGDDALKRIETIHHEYGEFPLAVEVRHGSFADEGFLQMLRDRNISFVNIDQPVFGDSIKPSAVSTADVGYVRFHGRNYQKWFAHEESWERYDYLYSGEELKPWVGRIRELSSNGDVYVVTNNHFRGQAIVNAAELKHSLGQPADVPPPLAEAYPERVGALSSR